MREHCCIDDPPPLLGISWFEVCTQDGDRFRVWRTLSDECAPAKSRPRSLASAQALVRFPPFREGGSPLDCTLAFERLVGEFDKLSPHPYSDALKISTLMSGLPSDVRRYLELNLDDSVAYERLRTRLLQYERSTAMWTSEHLLRSVGIDKDSGKFLDTDGVTLVEVDRIEGKGKGKHKGKGKGKGKDKGGVGFHRLGLLSLEFSGGCCGISSHPGLFGFSLGV